MGSDRCAGLVGRILYDHDTIKSCRSIETLAILLVPGTQTQARGKRHVEGKYPWAPLAGDEYDTIPPLPHDAIQPAFP